jgi:CheY-like chemotaxis protein
VRVLVVDDADDAREALAASLEARGATVRTAASAAEALAVAATQPCDVVLSDIAMPETDGYALLARLRALPRMAGVPVVALTALASTDEQRRALAAGFAAHVPKPLDVARVVVLVRELAGRRRPATATGGP